MRFMSRVATSRRGRRPSRDNYCAFDGRTIVAGSCESNNYRDNDWRGTGLGAHDHIVYLRRCDFCTRSHRGRCPSRHSTRRYHSARSIRPNISSPTDPHHPTNEASHPQGYSPERIRDEKQAPGRPSYYAHHCDSTR